LRSALAEKGNGKRRRQLGKRDADAFVPGLRKVSAQSDRPGWARRRNCSAAFSGTRAQMSFCRSTHHLALRLSDFAVLAISRCKAWTIAVSYKDGSSADRAIDVFVADPPVGHFQSLYPGLPLLLRFINAKPFRRFGKSALQEVSRVGQLRVTLGQARSACASPPAKAEGTHMARVPCKESQKKPPRRKGGAGLTDA
jgi:hypothetical protein